MLLHCCCTVVAFFLSAGQDFTLSINFVVMLVNLIITVMVPSLVGKVGGWVGGLLGVSVGVGCRAGPAKMCLMSAALRQQAGLPVPRTACPGSS